MNVSRSALIRAAIGIGISLVAIYILIRSVDIGCRVGGDEFAVVMPESTEEDAAQLFDRMRDGVATMPMPGGHHVRLSAGIAELRHGETAAALFERADAALRRSKDAGKDRATTASE